MNNAPLKTLAALSLIGATFMTGIWYGSAPPGKSTSRTGAIPAVNGAAGAEGNAGAAVFQAVPLLEPKEQLSREELERYAASGRSGEVGRQIASFESSRVAYLRDELRLSQTEAEEALTLQKTFELDMAGLAQRNPGLSEKEFLRKAEETHLLFVSRLERMIGRERATAWFDFQAERARETTARIEANPAG